MYQLIDKTVINAPMEEVGISSVRRTTSGKYRRHIWILPLLRVEKVKCTRQIIAYRVKPLLGIPMTWVTEITHVREKQFFVDEQRIGPTPCGTTNITSVKLKAG